MSEAYATIYTPDLDPVEFSTADEVLQFLDEQLAPFEWVRAADPSLYNQMSSAIANSRNHSGQRQHLQSYLTQTFLNYRFPMKGSPYAEFIENLRLEAPAAALLLLGFSMRTVGFDAGSWPHTNALGRLIAFDQKLSKHGVIAAEASFRRAVTGFQRQEAAARSHGTKFLHQVDEAEKRGIHLLSLAKRLTKRRMQRQKALDENRIGAILKEMEATKALYMEHMALQAPVEYWKRKASEHKTGAKTMRKFLLGYAVIGTIVLLAGLYYLFTRSIEVVTDGAPVSVLFILATMGIVVTTIAFWVGRILARLYLSEEHLKTDAGERATMVETYLALTKANQASKEDRGIILASLFRPTADGLVKDDAAPDLSPAGLISKLATPG